MVSVEDTSMEGGGLDLKNQIWDAAKVSQAASILIKACRLWEK